MRLSTRLHIICLALMAGALAACTSIPVTNIPKLMALDPDTMDIGTVEMAVRVPDDWRVREEGVALKMSLKNKVTGEMIKEEFVLDKSDQPLTPVLQSKRKKDHLVQRFEMSEETAARANAFRAQMIAMREKNPGKNEASISAHARMCLTPGANPFQNFRFTTYVRTDPSKDFFTLFKEQKIPIERVGGEVKYCGDEAVEAGE